MQRFVDHVLLVGLELVAVDERVRLVLLGTRQRILLVLQVGERVLDVATQLLVLDLRVVLREAIAKKQRALVSFC